MAGLYMILRIRRATQDGAIGGGKGRVRARCLDKQNQIKQQTKHQTYQKHQTSGCLLRQTCVIIGILRMKCSSFGTL